MVLYNWRILTAFLFVWASFMIVALPTDKTFGLDLQVLAECPKFWQFQHCCTEIYDFSNSWANERVTFLFTIVGFIIQIVI